MVKRQVVGVYDTDNEAIAAIQELKRQGYTADEISVISQDTQQMENVTEETDTMAGEGAATGAATGGVLGGLGGILTGLGALAIPGIGPIVAAGPIIAGITGAAAGAGVGGLAGALIGMGIPDDEAQRYNEDFENGKILVLVDSNHYTPTNTTVRRTTDVTNDPTVTNNPNLTNDPNVTNETVRPVGERETIITDRIRKNSF